ncbi:hypothetical protein QRO08_13935 [Paracidovorax citrulli]|uniref:DUF2486 family protein n=2 Tax=Paracidovorax citrulli TaxID=80869 RepID=A1TRY5_PARC0|nr:hypothetical protein [Paracidovorax citrulli]ABM33723.1 hypothetical protein Aave_3160 [Paracidovorax citrulli AAC00-1]ATG94318.1 hypothetical protein CQB05_09955 [Paracidovorax citrulli]MVT28326.1 hypothetical protein [Paracidovorax citrulli]PVY63157.1 hypothetical protein C8E08_0432 [Paracidovorax citrulli]REG67860.1 hypothetical protein C8E07_0947 [Paracidovorax citrulli]
MAATPPKGPPKFVPTLTDVVQVSGDAVPGAAHGDAAPSGTEPPPAGDARPAVPAGTPFPAPVPASAAPAATEASAEGVPIAAVPVLAAAPPAAPVEPSVPPLTAADFSGIEEMVIHRIIQRVDVVLDQRLREAIATVVQEQTRSMVPRLREEVESVVRHAVYEAVADELASPGGPAQR